MTEQSLVRQLNDAIQASDAVAVKELTGTNQALLAVRPRMAMTWLHLAARNSTPAVIDVLLAAGMDINAIRSGGEETPLSFAITRGTFEVATHLLKLGANPNADRMFIAAINRQSQSFEFVKLLVEHGADVNQCWWFGEEKKGTLINALSWATGADNEQIVAYLRSRGAVMPGQPLLPAVAASENTVEAYFENAIGDVAALSLMPIVPTDIPVQIHLAKARHAGNEICLFTTGMSEIAMTVPAGREAFEYAELAIYLPGDWPVSRDALAQPQNSWPVAWLNKIAAYPHRSKTWLGGAIADIANGNPPKPLAPNCPFSAILLLVDYDGVGPIAHDDGSQIRIYTLVPLYREEYELERSQGLPELMRRFDQYSVSKVVDITRKSVA